jgi:uncharacterized Zn finger protein
MFCFHKFSKVEADRYQYCTKCGIAQQAPHECKYEIINQAKASDNGVQVAAVYVSRCTICGNIKKNVISVHLNE